MVELMYSVGFRTGLTARDTATAAVHSGYGSFLNGFFSRSKFTRVPQMQEGVLTDDNTQSMSNYFYDLPTTNLRRNQHIYPSSTAGSLRLYNLPDVFARTGFSSASSTFLYPGSLFGFPVYTSIHVFWSY
jgi:hypothetical protein